jgi:hypothetical protein
VLREPAADEGLGTPLRRRVGRHRVHLGGVDEVDAALDRAVDLRVRLGLAVLLAPRHRAEARLGNLERRAGERLALHAGSFIEKPAFYGSRVRAT